MEAAAGAWEAPTIQDVLQARQRLEGEVVVTPLLESTFMNEAAGCRLLVKAENLQKTGSFKYRGAYNNIAALMPRPTEVVAFSSGNHAQGVAAAAAALGVHATIVMPEDAPRTKLENTRSYGAEVILYNRYRQSREETAAEIARQRQAPIVSPYDHPLTIAGQGTVGLEIAEQCEALSVRPDAVLVCCGGGGLISGVGLGLGADWETVPLYSVEPEEFDDTRRSLESGNRETNAPDARSICDALLSPSPGALTFPINRRRLAGGLTVSDEQALGAMALAFRHLKIVAEPGGAVAMAAAIDPSNGLAGKTVVAVCSGGNVDRPLFRRALDMVQE